MATEGQVSGLADSVPDQKDRESVPGREYRVRPALTGMLPAGELSEAGRQQLGAFSKAAAFHIVVALPPWESW